MGSLQIPARPFPFLSRFLALLLTVVSAHSVADSAHADCNTGFAAFAQMHPEFPRARLARIYWRACLPATAALWRTFGTDERSLRAFTERFKSRRHIVQLYAENGVGRRNRRPGKHDPFRAYSVRRLNVKLKRGDERPLRVWRALVSEIAEFVDTIRGPHTEPILAISLEDDHWDEVADMLLAEARPLWPWEISRNKNGNDPDLRAGFDRLEYHGLGVFPDEPRTITSLDGYNFRPDDGTSVREVRQFLARHRHTHLNFLWECGTQDICDGFERYRRRTFRVSDLLIRLANSLQRNAHADQNQ